MRKWIALVLAALLLLPVSVFAADAVPEEPGVTQETAAETDETAEKLAAVEAMQEKLRLSGEASIASMYDEYMDVLMSLVDLKEPQEIASIAEQAMDGNVHPRLFARKEGFDAIRDGVKTEKFMGTLYIKLQEYAETLLAGSPVTRKELGNDELTFARECLDRALLFGMLYQLDGEERYLDFLYRQMEIAIGDYMQWDMVLQLPCAEMTTAVALTYDWLYSGLDDSQRSYLVGILKKRLQIVEGYFKPPYPNFASQINNWNAVCNGSYGIASIAILAEDPTYASQMLYNTAKSITIGMSEMLPNGGFSEGPGYWTYQTQYITYLISCLDSALGTDFGLGEMPGFRDAVLFPVYMYGPTYTAFNFADSGESTPVTVYFYWFAKKYGMDGLQKIAQDVDPSGTNYSGWEMKGTDSLILLWYETMEKSIYDELPTGRLFRGKVPAASMRTEWDNAMATYVAFKGGHNQASHGNMDLGSFVMDALGQRWVMDLGGEAYSLEGYWDFGKNGERWTYFTQRAEGHNMFVINPSKEPDQDEFAKADIVAFDNDKGYGIIDLSAVYEKNANSAKRGIALCGDSVVIRDEITTKKADDTVVWGINTRAAITVGPTGKYADLSLNDKKLRAYIIGGDYQFEVTEAKSMVYPLRAGEKTFPDVRRLVIKSARGGDVNFSVQLSPYTEGEQAPQAFTKILPLSEWETAEQIYAYDGLVSQLLLDGEPLSVFSANKLGYTVYLDEQAEVPAVTMQYDTLNAAAQQEDATQVGETTTIHLRTKDPRINDLTYTITFQGKKVFGAPVGKTEYRPVELTFSDEGNVANPQKNLLDGRFDTRWSAEGEGGECEVVFRFEEAVPIDMVTLSFYQGAQRQTKFDLAVSEDGETYTTVYSGLSSGMSNSFEQIRIPLQQVKYVKYLGHGNSVSTWNSVNEIAFWGPEMDETSND